VPIILLAVVAIWSPLLPPNVFQPFPSEFCVWGVSNAYDRRAGGPLRAFGAWRLLLSSFSRLCGPGRPSSFEAGGLGTPLGFLTEGLAMTEREKSTHGCTRWESAGGFRRRSNSRSKIPLPDCRAPKLIVTHQQGCPFRPCLRLEADTARQAV
jgi:hypothetical protein